MTQRLSYPILGLFLSVAPLPLAAQEAPVQLHVPPALVESGLIKHILPRFTLKTRVRVELVPDPAAADILLGGAGEPLFEGLDAVWHLQTAGTGHKGAARFADWLTSEVGTNTIISFAPGGTAIFGPPPESKDVEVVVTYDGDARLGHKVSRAKCTRCHVVDKETRGFGIGSTPSFMVLRSLTDWEERFYAFYTLNPHPAFTVVEDLTQPFPKNRPPPIAPVELTIDEVDAIVAYVAALEAADLGAPLVHQ